MMVPLHGLNVTDRLWLPPQMQRSWIQSACIWGACETGEWCMVVGRYFVGWAGFILLQWEGKGISELDPLLLRVIQWSRKMHGFKSHQYSYFLAQATEFHISHNGDVRWGFEGHDLQQRAMVSALRVGRSSHMCHMKACNHMHLRWQANAMEA